MILSSVRSNPEDRIGFLKTDNRVNVSLQQNSFPMKRVLMRRAIINHLKKSKIESASNLLSS